MNVRYSAGGGSGAGRLRREGVVALERAELDVVDVDVLAGGDVAAGEADDLAVLEDRVALLDRAARRTCGPSRIAAGHA